MARVARADVFDPKEVSVMHCINKCVRNCYLCGIDVVTGKDFEYRKQWLERRFQFLASLFGIDILGFAILSNHFHLILRNRPDVVATWNDRDVACRWLRLCPYRKKADGTAEEPSEAEIGTIVNVPQRLAEIRTRLSHISWLMRMVAEPLARLSNKEEDKTGRFWQGRFRGVKLCDEAAILACGVYVDLNAIRAGLALTPEASDFTSAQRRIQALNQKDLAAEQAATIPEIATSSPPDDWLAPLSLVEATPASGPMPSKSSARCSDKGFLALTVEEYLQLLDWTGRQVVADKRGAIPSEFEPILSRLGIGVDGWLQLATDFGQLFQRVAGSCASVARQRHRRTGRSFRPGHARLLGSD